MNRKFQHYLLLTALLTGIIPSVSFAQDGGFLNDVNEVASSDPVFVNTSVVDVLVNAILWLLGIAAVIATLAIVWGGFMYIASFGDEGRASKGKKVIQYAIMGLLISGGSFFIISLVKTFLVG